ncbi:MAG: LysR family transcriptional regulator [Verrucomicrobiales bacterium]
MNVHHLELFFYVARHGGVSAAARAMPYGIQQPAISAQILQLEDSLGVTLYQRRPFQLTRAGQELYDFISPFFGRIGEVSDRLRGGTANRLRLAAAEVVQRDYLPDLLMRMRRRVERFHFTLAHGRQQHIESLLAAQEIDLGLSTLFEAKAAGFETRELARLPMVLVVSERSGLSTAAQILDRDRIDLPLVTLEARDALPRAFQSALRQRGVDWIPSLEFCSLDLVMRYVVEGFGVGLVLRHPRFQVVPGVRVLPLDDMPPLRFGALWTGRLSPLGETFLEEAAALAGELLRKPAD